MKAPPPLQYASPDSRRRNGLALWSLLCGLGSFVLVGPLLAIPAIILGHLSLRQLRRSDETGRPMALAGLAAGYLNIVVVTAVVVMLIFAMIAQQRVQCRQNLRNLGEAIALYAQQNQGLLPPDLNPATFNNTPAGQNILYLAFCPEHRNEGTPTYEWIGPAVKLADVANPQITPLVRDTYPHGDGARSVLFADLHVESLSDAGLAAKSRSADRAH